MRTKMLFCAECEGVELITGPMSHRDTKCSCGGDMRKIIVLGHGGVFLDDPLWLHGESGRQIREVLQDSDRLKSGLDKPIETRQEWKRHLDTHGIIPVDQNRGGNLIEI